MNSNEEIILVGIPAIQSSAYGKALVVQRDADWRAVPAGRIVVSRTSSPDCIFAMENAAGFAFEIGGPASHAAILAREFGKPCIVGVSGLLDAAQGNAFVSLSGRTGEVRVRVAP